MHHCISRACRGVRDHFRVGGGGLRSVARIFFPLLARKSSGFARILHDFFCPKMAICKIPGGCSPPSPPPPRLVRLCVHALTWHTKVVSLCQNNQQRDPRQSSKALFSRSNETHRISTKIWQCACNPHCQLVVFRCFFLQWKTCEVQTEDSLLLAEVERSSIFLYILLTHNIMRNSKVNPLCHACSINWYSVRIFTCI